MRRNFGKCVSLGFQVKMVEHCPWALDKNVITLKFWTKAELRQVHFSKGTKASKVTTI